MNLIKTIYCRAFQQSLHIAIPMLPYRKPWLLEDYDSLVRMLKSKETDGVMLITDQKIRSFGITAPLEERLTQENIRCIVYDKTVENPTTDNVEEARRLYLDERCSALIGFGGGSSIDCAKAAGARIAKPHQSLADMKGILKIRKKLPTLIAVPTTAGTGSETTLASVITDTETRHKYPINDFSLIPHYALLDPKITRTLPPGLTATTGMDALTHAVEAFIGRSTTRETREDAIEAVRLIFQNLPEAYRCGENMQARKAMLYAAFLAGCAFTKSYVGYVHAVAHSLGGKYNTPHGLANAVLLPHVLEAYGKDIHKKLCRLAVEAGLCDRNVSEEAGYRVFIDAVKKLQDDLSIPRFIKGIRREDIRSLARTAEKEANPLYPVPRLMTARQLEQFYYDVMEPPDAAREKREKEDAVCRNRKSGR